MLTEEASSTSLLTVGVMLQLTIPGDRDDLQCGGMLLGWKEGGFVISELPYQNGRPLDCAGGTPCVVRYLHAGKIVGYRSEVRDVQVSPEPMLFLRYPNKIEEILLRKHPRVHINQPITIMRDKSQGRSGAFFQEAPVIGVLKDLSVAGCRAALMAPTQEFMPEEPVKLEFDLPGLGHIMNLTGIVKNASGRPGQLVVGLEFQFYQMEYIEFRGWGGTVQRAIEQYVAQRYAPDSDSTK